MMTESFPQILFDPSLAPDEWVLAPANIKSHSQLGERVIAIANADFSEELQKKMIWELVKHFANNVKGRKP